MPRTPKAVALGRVLRRSREAADLSLREAALSLNRDVPSLSRYENGIRIPKPELVSRMLTAFGVDGARHDELMTLAYRVGDPQWLATTDAERRQQAEAYVEYERDATSILQVSPLVLPELLQTPAVLRSTHRTEAEVQHALRRQQVITGPNPTRLTALIGMPALHQHIGGTTAAAEQLQHLLALSRRPHIELRITPSGQGWHPGLEGPFTIVDSTPIGPVAFVETRFSTLWLHNPTDVSPYRKDAESIRTLSLSPHETNTFLATTAYRYQMAGCR
ncbi:helix-turn-helix domain-containing protein [Actinokineospora terrae]|uniref:Helix-turn-helix domain-containing protein n=1 Tax=Actinokineospora terrae TaxID=155974 RepID=A0A1H9P0Z4_9PSEU|nr:helix-turn-helix transcriptional regulator [Actinokineospora terrae]SER41585.1 Helix-turn-helix domain-containing protein [Actinokineospora terrae]